MSEELKIDISNPPDYSPSTAVALIANDKEEKKSEKLKKLLGRRELYKNYRLLGFNQYQSAIKAGYQHNLAKKACTELEPYVEFASELIKAGIDTQCVASKIKDQLEAESIIATRGGIIKDADWVARDKALDKALRFLVPEKKDSHKDFGGVQININLSAPAVMEKPIEVKADASQTV